MDERTSLLKAYFNQQACLDTPAYIFSDTFDPSKVLHADSPVMAPEMRKSARAGRAGSADALHREKPPGGASAPIPLPALALGVTPGRGSYGEAAQAVMTEKRSELAALFHEVKKCRGCGLAHSRNNFVFGAGNPDAPFLIIGEAPGQEEDAQGQPFVGAAGELLTKMLAAISIDRKRQAFITNILKCRPPNNRDPDDAEILACSSILTRQIDVIAPKVILLLGKIAARALLDSNEPIAQLRLRRHAHRGIPVFVTYHPAALLRNDSYRRPAWEDLKTLKITLQEIGLYDRPIR